MYGTNLITSVSTMAGVESLGQPAGTVTVTDPDGSTVVELTVESGHGTEVTVFLSRDMVAALMIALGAAAKEL